MGRVAAPMNRSDGASGSSTPGRERGAPLLLTVPELAEVLRVGRRAAYEAVARGDVPGVIRVGRALRISRAAVEAWIGAEQRRKEERREGET
jgi:excisionase family DNA binding protein